MDSIVSALSLMVMIIAVYGIVIYYEKQHVSKCTIIYKVKE